VECGAGERATLPQLIAAVKTGKHARCAAQTG